MGIKSQIPNLFTLSNLICGVLSIYFIFQDYLHLAAYLILLAAVFDFFDGLIARALGVSGELGKQLDSLADMVTFGVAPVFISLHILGSLSDIPQGAAAIALGFAPLLMGAMAAYRLAVFNIDTRQSDQFIGMPTPAVALFWVAVLLISESPLGDGGLDAAYAWYLSAPVAVAFSSLILAVLMVLPVPLIALKFKAYGIKGNELKYLLVLLSLVLLAIFAVKAVPIILLLYLVLSVFNNLRSQQHGIQSSN